MRIVRAGIQLGVVFVAAGLVACMQSPTVAAPPTATNLLGPLDPGVSGSTPNLPAIGMPQPIAPSDRFVVQQNDPATGCLFDAYRGFGFGIPFSWTAVEGAVQYELSVGQFFFQGIVKTASHSVIECHAFVIDSNLALAHWSWQVRAQDAAGTWGEWSRPSSFSFAPCRVGGGPCSAPPEPIYRGSLALTDTRVVDACVFDVVYAVTDAQITIRPGGTGTAYFPATVEWYARDPNGCEGGTSWERYSFTFQMTGTTFRSRVPSDNSAYDVELEGNVSDELVRGTLTFVKPAAAGGSERITGSFVFARVPGS